MEGEASVPKPVLFACDQAVAGLEVGFVAAEPDWTVEMLMGARRPWLARSQCRWQAYCACTSGMLLSHRHFQPREATSAACCATQGRWRGALRVRRGGTCA